MSVFFGDFLAEGALDSNGEVILRRVVRRRRKYTNNELEEQMMIQRQQWDQSTKTQNDGDYRIHNGDDSHLTSRVLDSSRAIRSIHSSASVRAIMERTKVGSQSSPHTMSNNSCCLPPIGESDIAPSPPRVVIYDSVGQQQFPQQKTSTVDPSNLPFLHRHPGV